MQVTHTIVDKIRNGQPIQYGYMQTMPETWIPKQVISGKEKTWKTDKIMQEWNV